MKYSIIFPCKNEEQTIGICIKKAKKILPGAEILVVDNNSTDGSIDIAKKLGARIVNEDLNGYGAAILKGISAARGEYLIICDADNTYNIEELPKLLRYEEYDIVIGKRKKIMPGAMSFLHQYIGNPVLSLMMRKLFKTNVTDTNSGFRLIHKDICEQLQLESTGMEFASEMIIKGIKKEASIKEVDVTYYPRKGKSKLNSFNDGWKHLKMMLLYSPDQLFLFPGTLFFTLGVIILGFMFSGPIKLAGKIWDIQPTIIGSLLLILGYQILLIWLYSKVYRVNILNEKDTFVDYFVKYMNLERAMLAGIMIAIIGALIGIAIINKWVVGIEPASELRHGMIALTFIMLGSETIFAGFLLSILGTRITYKHKKIK